MTWEASWDEVIFFVLTETNPLHGLSVQAEIGTFFQVLKTVKIHDTSPDHSWHFKIHNPYIRDIFHLYFVMSCYLFLLYTYFDQKSVDQTFANSWPQPGCGDGRGEERRPGAGVAQPLSLRGPSPAAQCRLRLGFFAVADVGQVWGTSVGTSNLYIYTKYIVYIYILNI